MATMNDHHLIIDDEYDRRACENILDHLSKSPSRLKRASARFGHGAGVIGQRATKFVPKKVRNISDDGLRMALGGLRSLTIEPALRSVMTSRVTAGYKRHGAIVSSLDDIRQLPLRVIDEVTPGLVWRYALGAAIEGAGAGALITGAEALTAAGTVASAGVAAGPTAGTVVAAIAGDAALTLAACARVVAHVGAYAGYDTKRPDEQVFAMALINWSSSTGEAAKSVAFQQLSQITQQLIRNAPKAQLSEYVLVKVVEEIYARLGFRMTKAKLGQVVPIAGIAIGAGLNAALLTSIARDAHIAYRARHLTEHYGVQFTDLTDRDRSVPADETDTIDVEEIIAVAQLEPPEAHLLNEELDHRS